MRSLVESILNKGKLVSDTSRNVEESRCLAYFITGRSGGSYGPATGFDLFKYLESKPLGHDAKVFKDDRLDVVGRTDMFDYYKCTGEHNSHLCAWLLKQLILMVFYSKFQGPITKDNIDENLKKLSVYFTKKYAVPGQAVIIIYKEGHDSWINKPHTGWLTIYVAPEESLHTTNKYMSSHCCVTYNIDLDK